MFLFLSTLFRLGTLYLCLARILIGVKIGFTIVPYDLRPRYNTDYGEDMTFYAWDFYYGGSQSSMKKIELDVHQMFRKERIWSNHELFELYSKKNRKKKISLIKYYRKMITSYFTSTEAKKVVYYWGVAQRRECKDPKQFKDFKKPLGNFI